MIRGGEQREKHRRPPVVLSRGDCKVMTRNGPDAKNGFPHFMLKEIYEQPEAVARVIGDRIDGSGWITLPCLGFSREEIREFTKITVAASGSSRHAGMVGEFMIERMTGL